jgi:hypothetical protein
MVIHERKRGTALSLYPTTADTFCCPFLALKGPSTYTCQCLLIEQELTSRGHVRTAAF